VESFNELLAQKVDGYIEGLFVPKDDGLVQALKDSADAKLPSINVSANEGKLLYLLTKMVKAARVLEIGTLGGFSAIWMARALPLGGRLITLEIDQKHAAVAQNNIDRAGVDEKVEIRVGRANALLQDMLTHGEAPFDLIFIDADKPGYVEYLNLSLQLAHPGTVILADNLIRNGRAMDLNSEDEAARGAGAYNAALALNQRLESIILPIIRENLDGLSISIVR
jgi:caffeoyl-CoA O-methyltransferase